MARAIAATLAPLHAADDAPPWLDADQARAFKRLLHAIRTHGAALCADPVGSGKTYLALAIARAMESGPAVCIVPPALAGQWAATAGRLEVPITLWPQSRLSLGQRPPGAPALVVLDESHHFRHPHIRRYRTLAPWLVGRRLLLLSATPIVNRPGDLYHQLHLGIRDDVLADEGALSLRIAFDQDTVPPELGRFVIRRTVRGTLPRRRHREVVVRSGAVPLLSALDALRLSSDPDIAALVRSVLLHAAASSPAALQASLQRYRLLLLHAQDATAAGTPVDRRGLRQMVRGAHEQLVMWSLFPPAGSGGELCPDDLPLLDRVLDRAGRAATRADPKSRRLVEVLDTETRTLVFVNARETISYLRRLLPDRWVGWCQGQNAGIGNVALRREEVLRWFRPDAPPHPTGTPGRPRTLLTTDVTSEGLDLQGAGRVVHYDLPWTDVRLAQREGRAIRRGSARAAVDVIRFLPARPLEERLRQLRAITRKALMPQQYGLGTENLRGAPSDSLMGDGVEGVCAVESSRAGALAGVVLERDGNRAVSAVFCRRPRSPWLMDAAEVRGRLHEAARAAPLPPPSKAELRAILATLAPNVRSMMRGASLARVGGLAPSAAALGLGNRLRHLAVAAARERDLDRLELLDRGLRFCACGHTAGEAMLIESATHLRDGALISLLRSWPAPPPPSSPPQPRLAGLIVFRVR